MFRKMREYYLYLYGPSVLTLRSVSGCYFSSITGDAELLVNSILHMVNRDMFSKMNIDVLLDCCSSYIKKSVLWLTVKTHLSAAEKELGI